MRGTIKKKKEGPSRRPKTEGYSNVTRKAKQAKRHEEAEARNNAWAKLPVEKKLASLKKRRGKSAKQVKRLQKQ